MCCVFVCMELLSFRNRVALFPLFFHGFSTKVFPLDATLQIDKCDMLGVW